MSQSNVEIIQNVYAAFGRGDGAAAMAPMDAGIVWNEAENFPYADRNPYIGPAAVGEGVFFRCTTEWESFQVVPAELLDAGDTVVALGRYKGTYKATGIAINAQFAHIWRLEGGRVKAFQQYVDTAQVANAVRG